MRNKQGFFTFFSTIFPTKIKKKDVRDNENDARKEKGHIEHLI